jgi:hypothetical protein
VRLVVAVPESWVFVFVLCILWLILLQLQLNCAKFCLFFAWGCAVYIDIGIGSVLVYGLFTVMTFLFLIELVFNNCLSILHNYFSLKLFKIITNIIFQTP